MNQSMKERRGSELVYIKDYLLHSCILTVWRTQCARHGRVPLYTRLAYRRRTRNDKLKSDHAR